MQTVAAAFIPPEFEKKSRHSPNKKEMKIKLPRSFSSG
jgi:hypothetical protein